MEFKVPDVINCSDNYLYLSSASEEEGLIYANLGNGFYRYLNYTFNGEFGQEFKDTPGLYADCIDKSI